MHPKNKKLPHLSFCWHLTEHKCAHTHTHTNIMKAKLKPGDFSLTFLV